MDPTPAPATTGTRTAAVDGAHLAALLQAGDEHRLEHGARGIDRRRIARRTRTDDEDRRVFRCHDVAFCRCRCAPKRVAKSLWNCCR